mgnify:CR=1 FL=1
MESSQTPPPGGSATPPPGGGLPPPAPQPSGPRDGGGANAGLRIGAVVLALALAIICAVAVAVMVDVNDTQLCEDVNRAEVPGVYECYDFSGSIKPVGVGAGWSGAVLTGVAAFLALAFTIRGRGGRTLLLVTAAAVAFLAISIVAAQV